MANTNYKNLAEQLEKKLRNDLLRVLELYKSKIQWDELKKSANDTISGFHIPSKRSTK